MYKDLKEKFAFTLGATHVGIFHNIGGTLHRFVESFTHVGIFNNTRRVGFTLAEVLITLGIIGIVASLTIPNLISKYNEKQTLSKLKKAYSTLSQAFIRSEFENGYLGNNPALYNNEKALNFYHTYWEPYLKIAKLCTSYKDCGYSKSMPFTLLNGSNSTTLVADNNPTHITRFPVITQDGILYILFYNLYNDDGSGLRQARIILVDLNGGNPPNKYGNDIFQFEYESGKTVKGYGYTQNDEEIKENCSKSGNGLCCSEAIIRNNWKLPDWYPIKF